MQFIQFGLMRNVHSKDNNVGGYAHKDRDLPESNDAPSKQAHNSRIRFHFHFDVFPQQLLALMPFSQSSAQSLTTSAWPMSVRTPTAPASAAPCSLIHCASRLAQSP